MADKENLEKEQLLQMKQALKAEEELLKKIISRIDAQVQALQVEQLNILGCINKNAEIPPSNGKKTGANLELKEEELDLLPGDLDLTVPKYHSSEEDEDDFDI